MRTTSKVGIIAGATALFLAGASATFGKAFVLPHVLEKSGTVNNTSFTFDTNIQYEDPNGPPGAVSTVQTYIYDTNGQPMTSATGTAVANPYTVDVTARGPRQTVSLDTLITNNGGFPSSNAIKLGFGIAVVSGADPENVSVQGFVVNSHSTPAFELSVFGFDPPPITGAAQRTAFVLPHVLEKSGKIIDTPDTFDTDMYFVYAGGLPGAGAASSAGVAITLWNDDNTRMAGSGGIVPQLNLTLDSNNRYVDTAVEDLINSAGGFGALSTRSGYATIDVTGDVGDFAAESFVQHDVTGPNDLAPDSAFYIAAVPEPASLATLLLGGLSFLRPRRKTAG